MNLKITQAFDSVDDVSESDLEFSVSSSSQAPDPRVTSVSLTSSEDALVDDDDVHELTVEEDLAELDYLQAQLKELKYLIREKKRTITQRIEQDGPSIVECDSLKCVAKTIEGKARDAAHKVIGKVIGGSAEEESLRFPKLHWPRPPFHHGQPRNHTCGPPKHGKSNHTLPHPPPKHGKGNYTHPPPHFKRPHLPFCHYPPPPPHHKPPHSKPPPHGEPPKDKPNDEFPLASIEHKPSQGIFQLFEEDTVEAVSAESFGVESFQSDKSHKRPLIALQVLGLGVAVFILTLIIKTVHHCYSSPDQKAARQIRRAERHYRSSLRRAALRESIHNLLTRLRSLTLSQQDEEKRAALLADGSDSTTMTEDIAGLMNAADMVSDIVAAEEGRARRNLYLGGEGETLPAYEGHDDSELGIVADGCRYTPGSSDYTPSLAGSASDILGADVKQ